MKVKWGGSDLQERLENFDDTRYEPYDGPRPTSGLYGWTIKRIKRDTSSGNFPCLYVHLDLHTRGRADHRKYEGFFMRDQVIVKDDGTTDFRVRPFLDAIGVTVRDFMNNTDVGDDGFITRIGKTKVGDGKLKVLGNIKPSKRNQEYFDIDYYPWKDAQATDTTGDSDDNKDDDGKPAPF